MGRFQFSSPCGPWHLLFEPLAARGLLLSVDRWVKSARFLLLHAIQGAKVFGADVATRLLCLVCMQYVIRVLPEDFV